MHVYFIPLATVKYRPHISSSVIFNFLLYILSSSLAWPARLHRPPYRHLSSPAPPPAHLPAPTLSLARLHRLLPLLLQLPPPPAAAPAPATIPAPAPACHCPCVRAGCGRRCSCSRPCLLLPLLPPLLRPPPDATPAPAPACRCPYAGLRLLWAPTTLVPRSCQRPVVPSNQTHT